MSENTYELDCENCGMRFRLPNYDYGTCPTCGAEYDYDEGHTMRPIPDYIWIGAGNPETPTDPANWSDRKVPGVGARIVIPPGSRVPAGELPKASTLIVCDDRHLPPQQRTRIGDGLPPGPGLSGSPRRRNGAAAGHRALRRTVAESISSNRRGNGMKKKPRRASAPAPIIVPAILQALEEAKRAAPDGRPRTRYELARYVGLPPSAIYRALQRDFRIGLAEQMLAAMRLRIVPDP